MTAPTESKRARLQRRLISIGLLAFVWHALTAALPGLLLLAWLAGVIRRPLPGRMRWVHVRLVALAWSFATAEVLGVLASAWLWLVHRADPAASWQTRHYRLQAAWARGLFAAVRRILSLDLVVEDAACAASGPQIMLVRHVSQADTLLPVALLSWAYGTRLRYVLKRALLWDPCLDVVGQRVPNAFIDRGPAARERELAALAQLATGLGPQDGVLLFPEGTRFSPGRRREALARLADKPELHAQAEQLAHLLPPRPAGLLALLDAAPDADVVICGHVGLEGLRSMASVMAAPATGHVLRVKFWRYPRAEIPTDKDARLAWLWARWHELDAWVDAHQRL